MRVGGAYMEVRARLQFFTEADYTENHKEKEIQPTLSSTFGITI
jgi:hypothetical protein